MIPEPEISLHRQIDAALLSKKWLVPLPNPLRRGFTHDQNRLRSDRNRRMLIFTCVIYNLTCIENFTSAPDVAMMSLLWRLLVLDPLVLLFLLLDYRGKLDRNYDKMLLSIAILPSLINGLVISQARMLVHLSNLHITPVLLITTGLAWRMQPAYAVINAAFACAIYAISMHLSAVVPHADRLGLMMYELAAGFAVIAITIEFEMRDRQIFLLRSSDRLRRAELAVQNRGLRVEAQTDALTGLPNRRGFDSELAEIWSMAQVNEGHVALIMVDVDRFKAYNDHYGHQAGDECLRQVVDTSRSCLRSQDLMARYGGEEFAVILPETSLDDAAALAQRMCDGIAAAQLPHLGIKPGAIVTASFGVACHIAYEHSSVENLITDADKALYQAKHSGRNRVTTAQTRSHEAAIATLRPAATWPPPVTRPLRIATANDHFGRHL